MSCGMGVGIGSYVRKWELQAFVCRVLMQAARSEWPFSFWKAAHRGCV